MPLPLDLRLALAPAETYRELMAEPVRGSWLRTLERPALVAVIVGTALTMSSGLRVPLGLVLMGILCWSFVPVIQLVIAAMVIGQVRGRPISMPRALELLFIGHLPWSLWILARAGASVFTRVDIERAVEMSSALIPAIWTTIIVFAFCRTALGCRVARARLLTVAHQTMMWAVFLLYAVLFSGVWARTLALIGA